MAGGRLPVASGTATVRALTRAGFVLDRIAGSQSHFAVIQITYTYHSTNSVSLSINDVSFA
jgi:hypothetical protein